MLSALLTVQVGVLASAPRLSSAALQSVVAEREDGQTFVIVLSHGRSASTITCGTLGALGKSNQIALKKELFGTNEKEMCNVSSPATTVLADWFELQARKQPHAHLIGFKFKNFPRCDEAHVAAAYDEAWDWIVQHGVRVVATTRNYLDTLLSTLKHAESKTSLTPHCKIGDDACLEDHRQVSITVNVSTLIYQLEYIDQREKESLATLDEKGVRYIHASTDDLFAGETSSRAFRGGAGRQISLDSWNAVLDFLGQPRVDSYDVIAAAIESSEEQDTSPSTQCEQLTNADEVRATLAGTRFESLLEC
jgi:hypothetical protein